MQIHVGDSVCFRFLRHQTEFSFFIFPAREAMAHHLASTSQSTEEHNRQQMTYRYSAFTCGYIVKQRIDVLESRSRRHIVARVGWFLACSRGAIRGWWAGGSWKLYGCVTREGRGKEKPRLQTRFCSLVSSGNRKCL